MVSSAVLIALVTSRDNTEYHLSQTCFFAAAYWWVGEYEPVARGEVRLWSGTSCVPLMARSSPRPRGQRRTGKMDEAGCEIICGAHKTLVVSHLVSWCLKPSHPQRITSELNTNFTLSQSYSLHKSFYHKSWFLILSLGSPRALHEEEPISQPLGALKGSCYCLKTLLHRKGRQLAQRLLLAPGCQNHEPEPVINIHEQFYVRIWVIIVRSCMLCTFMQHGRSKRRSHIWTDRNSPHLVTTHHRVQQGDALASRYPAGITLGLYVQYTQVIKKQKFFSYPPTDPSCCLLIRNTRAQHDQQIDWVEPTRLPIQEKSGPKRRTGPNRLQSVDTSISRIPSSPDRVTLQGKYATSLRPLRETFIKRYVVERANNAEIRPEKLNEETENWWMH